MFPLHMLQDWRWIVLTCLGRSTSPLKGSNTWRKQESSKCGHEESYRSKVNYPTCQKYGWKVQPPVSTLTHAFYSLPLTGIYERACILLQLFIKCYIWMDGMELLARKGNSLYSHVLSTKYNHLSCCMGDHSCSTFITEVICHTTCDAVLQLLRVPAALLSVHTSWERHLHVRSTTEAHYIPAYLSHTHKWRFSLKYSFI